MKISARVTGVAELARFDAHRLGQRLRAELERELQASNLADRPLDADARRAALEKALAHLRR